MYTDMNKNHLDTRDLYTYVYKSLMRSVSLPALRLICA